MVLFSKRFGITRKHEVRPRNIFASKVGKKQLCLVQVRPRHASVGKVRAAQIYLNLCRPSSGRPS